MLPSAVVTVLNDAIARAQAYLLPHQAPEGHWVGELEANTTITSEYLLLCHLIDRVDRPKEAKAVRYLRRAQLSDGGWSLFEGGPANLSATIKAYFAMRMAGVSVDDPALAAARERIREMGGPVRADVFTKILLALFGEYDWNGVPAMPVEIMLLPRPFFLFNIYEVSYWSRTVIVPLLIIMDRKPVKWLPPHLSLDELWPESREKTSLRFPRVPEPFSWRKLFWKNVFIAVDDGLKIWERFTTRPLRKRAVEAARVWLEERLAVPGGLGGIYPAMANSILASRLRGYPDDHPPGLRPPKEIEALGGGRGAMGEGAGAGLFLRQAGGGGGWGVVRGQQQPPLPQQHSFRRPRRPARPVDGGPDRARPRAPRHARVPERFRAGAACAPLPPSHAAARRPLVRTLGCELHLRHLVRPPRAPRDRRGPASRIRPASGALARASPEP